MGRESIDGSGDVVRLLISYIHGEGLKVGDQLPSVRRLSDLWGIGRDVLIDGFIQAESIGLIKYQSGSGSIVLSPDISPVMDALAITLDKSLVRGNNLLQLVEARVAIELEMVALAAENMRPQDVISLRELLEELKNNIENREAFVMADERFHLCIAAIAGNPVLHTILRMILLLMQPYKMSLIPVAQQSYSSHEDIYRCILESDVECARSAMKQHLSDHRISYGSEGD